jgi:adenosylcobinamide-GDP ribazoletransferase
MRRLVLALQFLTRMPLPAVAATHDDFSAAIRWFPAAGLAVGVTVAAATWLGGCIGPELGPLFGVAAWVGITGALHLDGLGDIADAAGAAHANRERLSAVLADPHIGSFGVTAIVLQVLAKLVLLHLLPAREPAWLAALVVIPAVARLGPLVWALTLPPLHEGLGSRFGKGAAWWQVAVWAAAFALALPVLPGLAVALAAFPLWGLWLRRRIGGLSGDGHGAGIELVESALLCALVVAG